MKKSMMGADRKHTPPADPREARLKAAPPHTPDKGQTRTERLDKPRKPDA